MIPEGPEKGETAWAARGTASTASLDEVRVYVVDDDQHLIDSIGRFLRREGYDIEVYTDPIEALDRIQGTPPTVLLVDQVMPRLGGTDLARRALEIEPDIAVILMTGHADGAGARDALRLGAVDYLPKPFDLAALGTAVRRAARVLSERRQDRAAAGWLRAEVERKSRQIGEVTLGVLTVLVRALEARFEYFGGHSERVAAIAEAIAVRLGLSASEVASVRTGALLHDIGMIAVPDMIVQKNGKLTADEYEQLQFHCQRGADILVPLGFLDGPARFILEHHERIDGSGYPLGLEGSAISLGGQVVGIAEAWAGMIEDRPFRDGMASDEALALMRRYAGKRFAPELVNGLEAVVQS